jgi:hypothetical protein
LLLGATADGAAIVSNADPSNPNGAWQLSAIDATGVPRWAIPGCRGGGSPVSTDDTAGVLINCTIALVLYDDRTGAIIEQVPYSDTSSNAIAADETLYTIVQSQATATTLGAGGVELWSAGLPAGFAVLPTDPNFFADHSAATAFDHRLLIRGSTTDGRPALAVLTDLAFTPPPAQPVPTQTTPPPTTLTVPAPTTVAPTTPPAPSAPTVCIRPNIDFAAVRDVPNVNGNLLAQIPPGTCGVVLVDTATVQGNGFAWYHVQWNGVDGWTAKSNTA